MKLALVTPFKRSKLFNDGIDALCDSLKPVFSLNGCEQVGAALRQLRSFLHENDKHNNWFGLEMDVPEPQDVAPGTAEEDHPKVVWVCAACFAARRRCARSQPATGVSPAPLPNRFSCPSTPSDTTESAAGTAVPEPAVPAASQDASSRLAELAAGLERTKHERDALQAQLHRQAANQARTAPAETTLAPTVITTGGEGTTGGWVTGTGAASGLEKLQAELDRAKRECTHLKMLLEASEAARCPRPLLPLLRLCDGSQTSDVPLEEP